MDLQSKQGKQQNIISSSTTAPVKYKAPWLGANIFMVLTVGMIITIGFTIASILNGGLG